MCHVSDTLIGYFGRQGELRLGSQEELLGLLHGPPFPEAFAPSPYLNQIFLLRTHLQDDRGLVFGEAAAEVAGAEDCLFLNVYTPPAPAKGSNLPCSWAVLPDSWEVSEYVTRFIA